MTAFSRPRKSFGRFRLLRPDTSRNRWSSGDLLPAGPTAWTASVAPRPDCGPLQSSLRSLVHDLETARAASAVPPEADVWYQRGLQAMRDGTYETARRSLEQAMSGSRSTSWLYAAG